MKTIVIFYSFTGKTREHANKKASSERARVMEVKEAKKRGGLNVWTAGLIGAIGGKASELQPLGEDLEKYDRIVIMSPVWANSTPPAINGVIDMLPAGKKVEVVMCSASGNSGGGDKIKERIKSRGCEVISYTDIK